MSPSPRPFRTLVALGTAVAALALTACTAATSAEKPVPVHGETKGPAGPVPTGLERFYGQSLGWGACQGYATTADDRAAFSAPGLECARLTVPMDYANPGGKTITLGLLRDGATDAAHRIGSLLVNPGGPGVSGMSAAAGLAKRTTETGLGRRFDLVGFDPRGIGASEPRVHCLTDTERDRQRAANDDTDTSPAGIARTEARERDYTDKCVRRSGKDLLANIGTRDVAKDMDVLRSALGDAKLTYVGFSYGTAIGTAYAEQFPANVRAMVLDGAVDPTQGPIDQVIAQDTGFEHAFEEFSRWCVAQRSCALGRSQPEAVARFQQLVRPLIGKPLAVANNRTLSYDDATTAVVQALYAKELWQPLNQGLRELSQGQGRTLMLLADTYFERGPDGHYSNTNDAFNAISCVDSARVTDPGIALEANTRARAVAPFLDSGTAPSRALDTCAFWPVPPTSQPHRPTASGLPPTLVISTTGDPATPYQAGVDLAGALGAGLLTFEGTQHTAFLQGNTCVDAAGARYLQDAALPSQQIRCG